MKQELLNQIDERLKLLRESWLEAKEEDKQKWMNRIDVVLDERLEIMKK